METNVKTKKRKQKSLKLSVIATVLFIVALGLIVFGIIKLMEGQTTVSGGYPEYIKNTSVSCESDSFSYPIFTYDNSNKKYTKVTAIFDGDKLGSIYLAYSLYYSDNGAIVESEANNHAAMNISFGKKGFNADALGTKFSQQEDRLQMSLYASGANLKQSTMGYFSLANIPSSLEDLKTAYEKQGFVCYIDE